MIDNLGDRMKGLEAAYTPPNFLPQFWTLCRLDGRCFHSYRNKMEKPFDANMKWIMEECCKYLIEETHAQLAYTQSDEITLAWQPHKCFFDAKPYKLASVTASIMSNYFNKHADSLLTINNSQWDCRPFQVPMPVEVLNNIVWRQQDAVRNSIQMVARSLYSHKECDNKNSNELQEMIFQKGINWNDYEPRYKRGSLFYRRRVLSKFTTNELQKLPPKHEARKNPDLEIERWKTEIYPGEVSASCMFLLGIIDD